MLCCQDRATVQSSLRAAGAAVAAFVAAEKQESETVQEQVLDLQQQRWAPHASMELFWVQNAGQRKETLRPAFQFYETAEAKQNQ